MRITIGFAAASLAVLQSGCIPKSRSQAKSVNSSAFDMTAEAQARQEASGRFIVKFPSPDKIPANSVADALRKKYPTYDYKMTQMSFAFNAVTGDVSYSMQMDPTIKYDAFSPGERSLFPGRIDISTETHENSTKNVNRYASDRLDGTHEAMFAIGATTGMLGIGIPIMLVSSIVAVAEIPAAKQNAYNLEHKAFVSSRDRAFEHKARYTDVLAAVQVAVDGDPKKAYWKTLFTRKLNQANARLAVADLMDKPAKTIPLSFSSAPAPGEKLYSIAFKPANVNRIAFGNQDFLVLKTPEGQFTMAAKRSLGLKISFRSASNDRSADWSVSNNFIRTTLVDPASVPCRSECGTKGSDQWEARNAIDANVALAKMQLALQSEVVANAIAGDASFAGLSDVIKAAQTSLADIIQPVETKQLADVIFKATQAEQDDAYDDAHADRELPLLISDAAAPQVIATLDDLEKWLGTAADSASDSSTNSASRDAADGEAQKGSDGVDAVGVKDATDAKHAR